MTAFAYQRRPQLQICCFMLALVSGMRRESLLVELTQLVGFKGWRDWT